MEALRERFGKYHVLEKIAQGGMAEIYKVKTVGIAGFEKIQALKRVLPHQARDNRFIRSFVDEARIAVELTHRNIVQVFDFGKADGELFLAMELIEGKDLRTALVAAAAAELPPPVPIAAYILSEIASGLDYAHRKTDASGASLGIVHCDVSPSNVMLSSEGDIKILDFGVARASFASALERRRLRGKPRYMAPEQTLGETPTAASDVFALGIIGWELFTGLPLFKGANLRAILDAVRRTYPPRLDRLTPEVPREIADAVAVALTRDPARRGTAADLVTACARTALPAGSRALARWLGAVDGRPSQTMPWNPRAGAGGPSAGASAGAVDATGHSESTSVADLSVSVVVDSVDLDRGADGVVQLDGDGRASGRVAHVEPTERIQRRADGTDEDDEDGGGGAIDSSAIDEASGGPRALRLEEIELVDDEIHDAGDEVPTARADDDATAARYARKPSGEPPGEAPIDDDLADAAPGVHAAHRRIVIAAGLVGGAPAEALRPVAKSLGELAYQRGGVVLERTPDGLVVAFGLEVAGEDDVAVAMGWALDAAAIARDSLPPLFVRIGACAATATGDGQRIPPDDIEHARQLSRDAAPERPLFTGGPGRLTSSLYALRELPPRHRAARRGTVTEVLGPRGFVERDRARLARRGNFVGRAGELAELDAWLARAIAGSRRMCVLITGAAGIGKSRLVAELIARRAPAGNELRVITTAASPVSRLTPFALLIDLYQAALGLPPARGRAARAQLIAQLGPLLHKGGASVERAREITGDLKRAMELRDGVAMAARDAADLRQRLSAGLAAFRTMTLTARPALTVVEDVHFADAASREVLRHIVAMSARGAELLILTARPEGPPPPEADAVLVLGDLSGADSRTLIADRLGEAAAPSAIAAVLARSGGNPLFIEELAQAVRDAGPAGEVPASARDVVQARIERLSPNARATLRFAAVLGPAVRIRLLDELLDEHSEASERRSREIPGEEAKRRSRELQDEDGEREALDELIAAGFLVRPGSDGAAEGELSFARGLVREVAYDSLAPRVQRETHVRIGRLLASRFFAGREEPPAAIAEHLERGGELAGAAAFWLRTGRLALAASDADTAIAAFTRTLALDRESVIETGATATAIARRREALAGREEARRLAGDLVSDASDLDELEDLCAGEPARLADVAIRRALRLLARGELEAANDATIVAEAEALAADDDRLRGEALRVRGEILERVGRFDDALVTIGAARELFRRRGTVADEMSAMVVRGRIHLRRAHYEAAHDAYRPVIALIKQTGDPWLERIVKSHVAVIETCLGNFAPAMRCALRSLELCRRYGDRSREGDALMVAGIVLLEVGLYDQAAAMFGDALDILSRASARWSRADCLIYAGTCEQRRGRTGGLPMLDEAVAEARMIGARYLEASALVARAAAYLRNGALTAAIADASNGAAIARDATLIGYEIQGLARHAVALSRLGNRGAEASALAHRALGLLDVQKYFEGSVEDVLVACSTVLRASGARERADAARERGRASAERKLAAMPDPTWRAAYAAIPEIAALLV